MSSRSRGLIAAVLITGALATLPACGSKDKNAGAPSSSAPNATTAGAASGSQAPSASPTEAATTAGGTTVNSGTAGQAHHLPAPGGNLTLAAVSKDTVFYGVNNTDDKTALKTYLTTLKKSGYTVTPVRQDDAIITYKAQKGSLSLTVASASGVFTLGTGNMLIVRVDRHDSGFTLPQSPPSGGLETRVPASKGNIQFIAAGKNHGTPVAFYRVTGFFKDYLAALKNAGYTVAPAKQDGEPIKNTYTATKSGRHLTLEQNGNWITESTLVVTP